jgi:ribonuclease HII
LINEGYGMVAGVDEAGRGPLAGPVVAAACMVPLDVHIEGIFDSKKLTEAQRELLYDQLTTNPKIIYSYHVVDHNRIDDINILEVTLPPPSLLSFI